MIVIIISILAFILFTILGGSHMLDFINQTKVIIEKIKEEGISLYEQQ